MTIFAGIAEFELDLIRERNGVGRGAAKKRGVQLGGPERLLWIRVNWNSVLLGKGSPGN
jgi:DNA invertase Pin-like site-specific DNA recombinase